MKPTQLRLRLKPEQRILSLTIVKVHGKHRFLLGIVYRGSRWLDGVIFEPLGRKRSHGVTEVIKHSPYYKELRYIMFRRSNISQIDGETLNEALELPVIGYEVVKGKMGRVASWGVEKKTAVFILNAFQAEKPEPDAVHLANLLKRALE